MAGHTPQRSCLGCGQVRDKSNLFRFVLGPGNVLVPDLKGKLPGRGAYTCMNRECINQALRKKRFAASFRTQVASCDGSTLVASICDSIRERIRGYLALAAKAGKVFSGSESVTAGLRGGTAGLLFMATDISEESRKKFVSMADYAGVELAMLFDRDSLGLLIGKEHRSVVAVERGGFVAALLKELEIYRNFFEGEV